MYTNIRSHLAQGYQVRHKLSRFPPSQTELERLTGLTIANAYGCQEAASPIVDLIGTQNLVQGGTPFYRKPLTNMPEMCLQAAANALGGWFGASVVMPGTDSFLLASFSDFNETPESGNECLFAISNNVGVTPYAIMRIQSGNSTYRVLLHDGTNAKTVVISGIPYTDKKPRGWIFHYDAATGIMHTYINGMDVLQSAAIGTWNGIAGATPVLDLGAFYISSIVRDGSDQGIRYAFYAHGAQLDNWSSNIIPVMRRLGWS